MEYLQAFLVGGILCLIGQILVDKTSLTPARILVSYVVAGVVLGALGIYEPIVQFGGAGATVPLTGFGYNPVSYTHLWTTGRNSLPVTLQPLGKGFAGSMRPF